MKRLACAAVLAMAVTVPATAAGQEATEPEPGPATSLSLRPLGTPTIGVWRQFGPRLEVGVEAGVALTRREQDGEDTDVGYGTLSLEPIAKFYGAPRGDLRPYTAASLYANVAEADYGGDDRYTRSALGASLGVGMEWSPAPRVRIGGHAGVRGGYGHDTRTGFNLGVPEHYENEGWEAATFTTGLTVYYTF